jgi:hypothetical protein
MSYRLPERKEIVLRGRPRTTVYLLIVWLSFGAFAVLVYLAPNAFYARILLSALTAIVVLALLAIRRAARAVRWLIILDRLTLRIERVGSHGAEFAALDVSEGVRIAISVTASVTSVDPCIILDTHAARVELPVGPRPGDAVHELAAFLRDNDVAVTLDPDLPLGPVDMHLTFPPG